MPVKHLLLLIYHLFFSSYFYGLRREGIEIPNPTYKKDVEAT